MISSALSYFILFIVILHKSQCDEIFWRQFKSRNLEPEDALICYTTVTSELFENLKKIVDVSYVERGEAEFKSKFDPKSDFFSFSNEYKSIPHLFSRKINEIEITAKKGILRICQWLEKNCTPEKPKQILEFTKIFREKDAKCVGGTFYLIDAIWRLEGSCPVKEDKDFVKEKQHSKTAWKNQMTYNNRFGYL